MTSEMKYRRLGRTGLRVSVVGIGTWQFGGEWGRQFSSEEATDILSRAEELGVNLVDTAECYGDHLSENLVGQALTGRRQNWLIGTKFGHRFTGHLQRQQLWQPQDVQKQLEDSLRALKTDYIDIYQFHSGSDVEFDNDALWTMLHKQVKAGKIRILGISISSGIDPEHQVQQAAVVGAGVLQVVYNRLDRRPESTIFPGSIANDLGILARIPLASGLLSGKYDMDAIFTAPDDVRTSFAQEKVRRQLAEVQDIRASEVPDDVPMSRWALAWCLQHSAVTCVIPGCKTLAQVEDNVAAAYLDMVSTDHAQAI